MIKSMAFIRLSFGYGGADRVSYDTIEYLSHLGIQCHIITKAYNPWSVYDHLKYGLHVLPRPRRAIFSGDNLRSMIDYIRQQEIEVLFIDTPYEAVPEELRTTGSRIVYWLHNIPFWEVIQKRDNGLARARQSLPKWLEWQLITRPKYFWGNRLTKRIRHIYTQNLNNSDYYVVLCDEYGEELKHSLTLSRADSAKIVTLINTIPIRKEVALPKEKKIIYVGRLSHSDKRVDRLLSIWQMVQDKLPDRTLDIYGEGPQRKHLESLAKELHLERCHFRGRVTSPQAAYDTASILCLTSTYEGWPMVMMEAQNNGVIPIAFSSCAGIRAIAEHVPPAGVLIQPFDLNAYADALVSLCTDPSRMEQLQRACLDKRQVYTQDSNLKVWEKLIAPLTP